MMKLGTMIKLSTYTLFYFLFFIWICTLFYPLTVETCFYPELRSVLTVALSLFLIAGPSQLFEHYF